VPAGILWLLVLVAVWAVVAGVRYLWFWRAPARLPYPVGKLLYFGHRGVPSRAPENTIPSLQAAFEAGMDGIEVDVMPSLDGELIVKHDHDLERTTDGTGYVWETTYGSLAELNAAHHWATDYAKTPLPRLEEVLAILPDNVIVNVELKTRHWIQRGFEQEVVALVRKYRLVKRTIISSFNPISIMKVRWLEPELATGLIWSKDETPWYLRRPYFIGLLHPDFLHPKAVLVTPDIVAKIHRRGMRVNVWTVNNRPLIQYLESIGVDAIFTDFPERMPGADEPV
jgi:glycerophosphoryl diester phosphodiesterase